MPIKSAKVCALPKRILCLPARWPVVPTSAGRTQPSNILMHIESAKTIALEQKNFSLEKFTYLGVIALGRSGLALTKRERSLFLVLVRRFGLVWHLLDK